MPLTRAESLRASANIASHLVVLKDLLPGELVFEEDGSRWTKLPSGELRWRPGPGSDRLAFTIRSSELAEYSGLAGHATLSLGAL